MSDPPPLFTSLDGEVFSPGSSGYEAARGEVDLRYREVRPRLVVRCRSVADVISAVTYASASGDRLVPRGGGHCFAGRSTTEGIVLDLSGFDVVSVAADGVATIGAGVRLARVYAELHAHGRTLPAGCGETVGISGLALGGGIGLLGRLHGLTCDRLVGAQVVLANGSVVECAADRHPDLFWALRGAGGGQFGVVTSLQFATVAEPTTTRIRAQFPHAAGQPVGGLADLVGAWQAWAPDAPDELTANLTLVSEARGPVRATLFGASTLSEGPTRALIEIFIDQAGVEAEVDLRGPLTIPVVKRSFDQAHDEPQPATRSRSEFFSGALAPDSLRTLLAQLTAPRSAGRRSLAFTAMGGAYNRVAENATAFAHRSQRFLLEHLGDVADPWVDQSWATAHVDGSGRVYPNFPDPALDDWADAYHAGNYRRLVSVKSTYDPHRFFDFPQAV